MKDDEFKIKLIDEYNKLQRENDKYKKILKELRELSLKTYDVADFQMYFEDLDEREVLDE